MASSEDYKKLYELYQVEGVQKGLSVHLQCIEKNAQSFGSEEGVQEACLFFTLCETCKNFSVNFKEYVAYAAKELISGNTDYESLAPWAIKLV